jgi:DNA mismatch repair ATPase MutS
MYIFLLIFGIYATLIIGVTLFTTRRRKLKDQQFISEEWANVKNENLIFDNLDFDRIGRYAMINPLTDYHKLSSQTTNDIDFLQLFCFIDRTTSRVGQQYLFRRLLHPGSEIESLEEFDKRIEFYRNNPPIRESIQKELIRLNSKDAYHITALLSGEILQRPSWFYSPLLNVVIFFGLAIISLWYPQFLLLLIFPAGINMVIHYLNKNNSFKFSKSFPQLVLLLNVARNIWRQTKFPENVEVGKALSSLKYIEKNILSLAFTPNESFATDLNQVGSYLGEFLKSIFAFEFYLLFYITRKLENNRDHLRTIFDYVGDVDSAISVASLRSGPQQWCKPEFHVTDKLECEKLYHPLIQNCVTNNLKISGKGILITGSNMSGKSTFLRSLTINSILAQTIFTCFGGKFVSPVLKQFSFIRIDDNLQNGSSYFYEEIKQVKNLLNECTSPAMNLFVIDELFKGTNTVERISSSKAVLSYLLRNNNLVVISTHDIELVEFLLVNFDQYHFTETVENDNMHFDHILKSGPLRTRNAIAILKLSGFPQEVIDDALTVAQSFPTSGDRPEN